MRTIVRRRMGWGNRTRWRRPRFVRLLRVLGIAPGANLVRALAAEEVPPRPLDRSLDVRRAAALLGTPLLGVDEALAGMRGDGRAGGGHCLIQPS